MDYRSSLHPGRSRRSREGSGKRSSRSSRSAANLSQHTQSATADARNTRYTMLRLEGKLDRAKAIVANRTLLPAAAQQHLESHINTLNETMGSLIDIDKTRKECLNDPTQTATRADFDPITAQTIDEAQFGLSRYLYERLPDTGEESVRSVERQFRYLRTGGTRQETQNLEQVLAAQLKLAKPDEERIKRLQTLLTVAYDSLQPINDYLTALDATEVGEPQKGFESEELQRLLAEAEQKTKGWSERATEMMNWSKHEKRVRLDRRKRR